MLQPPMPPPPPAAATASTRPILVVDNGSSYTDDLVQLLDGLGRPNRRVIPSELGLVTLPRYGGIILSGRKRDDRLVNRVNSAVVRYALATGTKLLGVCYGAEITALSLGGTIRRSAAPQKGVSATVRITGATPITPDAGSTMDVFESHKYEISRLPPALEAVGGSEECMYEIIRYRNRNVYGTQFHPEMSRDGRGLLERFCALL